MGSHATDTHRHRALIYTYISYEHPLGPRNNGERTRNRMDFMYSAAPDGRAADFRAFSRSNHFKKDGKLHEKQLRHYGKFNYTRRKERISFLEETLRACGYPANTITLTIVIFSSISALNRNANK